MKIWLNNLTKETYCTQKDTDLLEVIKNNNLDFNDLTFLFDDNYTQQNINN